MYHDIYIYIYIYIYKTYIYISLGRRAIPDGGAGLARVLVPDVLAGLVAPNGSKHCVPELGALQC